jgi:cytochrome c551/c552
MKQLPVMLVFIPMLVAMSAVAKTSVDADAAITLARSAHCTRCHGEVKEKRGPTFKSVAESYKSKVDGETALYEHIAESPGTELKDGKVRVRRAIQNRTPDQVRNLAAWILNR